MYEVELFIRVRWAWLALPAFLVLSSMGFLVASIIQTQRLRVGVWKSSPPALLYASTDQELHRMVIGGMNHPDGLAKRVGHMDVRLEKEGGGWTFKSVEASSRGVGSQVVPP